MFRSLVLSLCGFLVANDAAVMYLDDKQMYRLEWNYSDVNITFTVTVNTTGWVGLGFSPDGGMAGSDIVTGWVSSDGTSTLQDRHATGMSLPDLDIKQDYYLLKGVEADGQTILQFTRLLDTHDTQDAVITDYTTRIIYAYGTQDPTDGNPTYHGPTNRGSDPMYLLTPQPDNLPNDSFTIDFTPEQPITIPSKVTTYWCSLAKVPQLDTKHHIVKYEPLITPGNKDIVHHMLVYVCYGDVDTTITSYDCFSGNPPASERQCLMLLAMWAVGGGAVYYPEQAGYPLGGGDSPKYVLFQTHYNNVMTQSGRIDQTGLRLTVTKSLRQFDAGILQVGVVEGMFVPPQQKSFQLSGFCPDPCLTDQLMPKDGVTVFGVGLHSHLIGRRLTLRQYRNGKELPPMDDDPYYDFNYQQIKLLNNPIKLLPGDTLQSMCIMNSTQRSSVTFGGLPTTSEMCLSFVMHYPRLNLTSCMSVPTWVFNFPADPMYKFLNVTHSIDWNNGYSPDLEAVDWKNPIYAQAVQARFAGLTQTECLIGTTNITYVSVPWTPPSGSALPPVLTSQRLTPIQRIPLPALRKRP